MRRLGWVCAAYQQALDLEELQTLIPFTLFEQPTIKLSLSLLLLADSLDEFEIPMSLRVPAPRVTGFRSWWPEIPLLL